MADLRGNRAKWKQIAEIIRARIEDGTYGPGEKVPTVLELVQEFSVANVTAQKAIKALRADGLIYTEPGLGSFVVEGAADDESA